MICHLQEVSGDGRQLRLPFPLFTPSFPDDLLVVHVVVEELFDGDISLLQFDVLYNIVFIHFENGRDDDRNVIECDRSPDRRWSRFG